MTRGCAGVPLSCRGRYPPPEWPPEASGVPPEVFRLLELLELRLLEPLELPLEPEVVVVPDVPVGVVLGVVDPGPVGSLGAGAGVGCVTWVRGEPPTFVGAGGRLGRVVVGEGEPCPPRTGATCV